MYNNIVKIEHHRSAELGAIGLVMSGLAFAGMIGVAEIINHSGGFLKKGESIDVLENRKSSAGKGSKSKRSRFYMLIFLIVVSKS